MTSIRRDVVGFFEEPTTYKHDFSGNPPTSKSTREKMKTHPHPSLTEVTNRRPDSLDTITSYDTLQKLSYERRIPFDAMLQPKEILATNPRETFCQRVIKDEGLTEAIRTRPRLYVSPGISLDNVGDNVTRKLMVDFTYLTTSGRASKEAWTGFQKAELCLPNSVFEKNVNPLALHLNLQPDLPAGFQSAARKWDRIQERYQITTPPEFSKSIRNNMHASKALPELLTTEEKNSVRTLISEDKLRLPYDKMPLSYGGFRPMFANDVPLRAKDPSPLDPNLSVAKAIHAVPRSRRILENIHFSGDYKYASGIGDSIREE